MLQASAASYLVSPAALSASAVDPEANADHLSAGHLVAGWDPPRRLVYEEDWAALVGEDPDALSPLTSEFLVEARSGGTCIVRVTSSRFGIGADWESAFWHDIGANRMHRDGRPGCRDSSVHASSVANLTAHVE